MSLPKKIALAGSHKVAHPAEATASINKDDIIEVTVRIRRKKSLEDRLKSGQRITRENYEKEYGSSQEDVNSVEAFAQQYHLSTVATNLARRSAIFRGSITNMEAAFGVSLSGANDAEGNNIRVRSGEIFIPETLKGIIEGVFGLDNRPVARPMFKISQMDGQFVSHAAAPQAFTPDQLAKIYGFPTGVDGTGQTIGIIELGGGFVINDIATYFSSLGINTPAVKAISIDGGTNSPTTPDSADGEVMLDIEVAGAVAPGASIAVYFCPNTDQGFLDAITTAVHDNTNKPSVISISWGGPEISWTQQSLTSFNEAFQAAAALGVTITVAAGDSGSSDGVTDGNVHVDFPASSPYVLACGGTSLQVDGSGQIIAEVVWHDSSDSATGGGVSEVFPIPDYQANANVPVSLNTNFAGRGLPDVAGDADPNTGYKVLVDGQQLVIGGTSAVAPLMAGLIALVNQQKGTDAGFINTGLYANPAQCRDIISGDNNTTSANTGYSASPGWDACTGWGVLNNVA
jgi:kumamolisin